jgi:hypothetical protein
MKINWLRIFLICLIVSTLSYLYLSRVYLNPSVVPLTRSTIDDVIAATTDARYLTHLQKIKTKVTEQFSVLLMKPFVVVSDCSLTQTWFCVNGTMKPIVDLLQRDFFPKEPAEIITIWLFKDNESYRNNSMKLYGMSVDTPFGFYSRDHNVLIMNIATGTGTLIHEICHPLTEANFATCPPWLFEGLGSLFEQASFRDEQIKGLINWRLTNLQTLITTNSLPTIPELFSKTEKQFYDEDTADNYAQSRYLCYFLQEKGLLKKYLTTFRKNCLKDPTGLDTFTETVEISDIAAFEKEWQEYIGELSL